LTKDCWAFSVHLKHCCPCANDNNPDKLSINREELVERIARAIREDGTAQPLQGLHLYRHSVPLEPVHGVVEPSLCVVAQGSKEFLLGDSRHRYDPLHYLLVTVDLPTVGQILEASKERPFLGLRLELDPALVGAVMVEAGHSAPPGPADVRAIAVSPLDVDLLDSVVRLVRLLDAPAEARILMPLITREIIYRLLVGEQGGRLRHLAALGGLHPPHRQGDRTTPSRLRPAPSHRAARARAGHERLGFAPPLQGRHGDEPLAIPEAAAAPGGPPSDAGRRPRRAASAAYRVGYHDASHFNREYKSLFGVPPMRDVRRLREAARASAGR
jgi:AraC-like DNA-binding protein